MGDRFSTLTFIATAVGDTRLELVINDGIYGAFIAADGSRELSVELLGADIEISAVPLPAAAWMLLSAVGVLGLRRRHRT